MRDFFVPKDLLLFSNNMGMNSDFSVRGFSGGLSEPMSTLTVTVSIGAAQLWTPAEITTTLWLDAADTATVALSGSVPVSIADKSGNGIHAQNNTHGTYVAGSQNGLHAVHLSTTFYNLGLSLPAGNYSIFLAVHPTTVNTFNEGKYFLDAQTGRLILAQICSTGSYNTVGFFDGSWRSIAAATSNAQILGYILDSAGASVFRDGNQIGTAAYTPKAIGGIVKLFRPNSGTTSGAADGKFFEMILAQGVVDTPTRQKIEGYLAHKWGLSANLPSDHPYKSAPPTI